MEYGLIGEKLGHSYSKQIHEMLADYTYDLCPLTKEDFHEFMKKKNFKAVNVTIPYKRDVIQYIDELSSTAESIGAVNTIVNKNNRLYGYNTDYYGFLYTLANNNIIIQGKKVLVLGNGGSAQAVFEAVKHLHAKEMYVVKHKKEDKVLTYEEAKLYHSDADIIINTSPVGMYPNISESPIDLKPYTKLNAAIDLIFNPLTTKFLAQAEALNIKAVNGLEMLVAQAKYAVEYFLDVKIQDTVIKDIYKNIIAYIINN